VIEAKELKTLLNSYGIEYEKIINKNSKILNKGTYENIKEILEYLVIEKRMRIRSIEKCSSILCANINTIKENYDDGFLKSTIVITSPEHLQKVFELLKEKNTLSIVKESPSILRLKYKEITTRMAFLEENNLPLVTESYKFNSIFGMNNARLKKNYNITQEDLNEKYIEDEKKYIRK